MDVVVVPILLGCGLVHLLPVVGVTGAAALRRLYGVDVTDPDLLLLLRHRAVLLGLLGAVLVGSVAVPAWRLPAVVVALASTLPFVLLAALTPGPNAQSRRTSRVDVVCSAALVVALALSAAG